MLGMHPVAMGEMARKRHVHLASAEGAAMGAGGVFTIVAAVAQFVAIWMLAT